MKVDLTNISLSQDQVDKAHRLREELLSLCRTATAHYFRLGEIMKEIHGEGLWRTGYESFEAFCADPELGFDKSSVYRAMKLVDTFPTLEERECVALAPLGKVIDILPYVTSKNKDRLVGMASSLSRSDLRHELSEMRVTESAPKFTPLPKIYLCNTCKRVKGVNFDGLCHCGWTPRQIEIVSKAIEKIEFGGEEDDDY